RDLVLDRAAGVKQIIMPPAVTLGPVNKFLPIIDKEKRFVFDVCVQPLLDKRLDLTRHGIGNAHVDTFHVAARTIEIQFVRSVAEPSWLDSGRLRASALLLLLLLLLILLTCAVDLYGAGPLTV